MNSLWGHVAAVHQTKEVGLFPVGLVPVLLLYRLRDKRDKDENTPRKLQVRSDEGTEKAREDLNQRMKSNDSDTIKGKTELAPVNPPFHLQD